MSSVKNGKKKDIKIILLGFLVGLVVCGAGIYCEVSSRIASHEYKNSTDIREVSAGVGYCREVVNKDKDEDGYHREREFRDMHLPAKTFRMVKKCIPQAGIGRYATSYGNLLNAQIFCRPAQFVHQDIDHRRLQRGTKILLVLFDKIRFLL